MLDWLKEILGESWTDEIDKKVSDEIGKGFVSRSDFNTKNEELKTAKATLKERDGQLEDLKKTAGNTEELRSQIEQLQKDNAQKDKDHAAALKTLRIDSAVDLALTAAKARNKTAARALLADFLKTADVDEAGAVKGLDQAIDGLVKGEDSSFLFGEVEPAGMHGAKPGQRKDGLPGKGGFADLPLAEKMAYANDHPGDAAVTAWLGKQ